MKKILLTLIIFLSFFWITQTFAWYEYININTLSWFSKYNVNATLPTDYYEYRFTGNYNDLWDKSGLYFYYPEFNQYLSVYSYLPSYSPCEESFVYDYQVSQNRSRVVCYSSDYEWFNQKNNKQLYIFIIEFMLKISQLLLKTKQHLKVLFERLNYHQLKAFY